MRKTKRAIAFLVLLLLLLFLPLSLGENESFWRALANALHFPLFLALTLVLLYSLHRTNGQNLPYWRAFFASVLFNASVEMLQPLAGRSSSATDLVNGICGTLVALSGVWLWSGRRSEDARTRQQQILRIFHAAGSLALFAVILQPTIDELHISLWRTACFPNFGDFEHDIDIRLWQSNPKGAVVLQKTETPAASSGRSLQVRAKKRGWAGVSYRAEGADWQSYRRLKFDVFNPEKDLTLHLRIDDDGNCAEYENRFNRALPLMQGWNSVSISLADIIAAGPAVRRFNLASVQRLYFFVKSVSAKEVFYLDNVGLE